MRARVQKLASEAGRLVLIDWILVGNGWFDRELNNAHLASVGAYDRWVPAFEAMLEDAKGDIDSFYDAASGLAKLEPGERRRRLTALTPEPVESAARSDT